MKNILTIGLIFILVKVIFATNWYVSTTGSNITGNGTAGNPWQTIQFALDHASVLTGDNIYVASGSYQLSNDNPIKVHKGVSIIGDIVSPSNVIIKAPISGVFQGRASCFVIYHSSGTVTIKGFTIKDAPMLGGSNQNAGIWIGHNGNTQVWPVDNVIIENNILDNCANGIILDANQNITIKGNVIKNSPRPSGTWTGIGINIFGRAQWRLSQNLVIQNNEIFGNQRAGIIIDNFNDPPPPPWGPGGSAANNQWFIVNASIKGNVVYNNGSDMTDVGAGVLYRGIHIGGHQTGIMIENNTVYGHSSSPANIGTSAGINIAASKDINIKNNIVYGNLRGIRLYGSGLGLSDETTGHILENNIIYNNVQGLQVLGNAGRANFNKIYDNNVIFAGVTNYGVGNTGTILFDAKNNWWGDISGPNDPKTLPSIPNYNNPAGLGDLVTAYVDYSPWISTKLKLIPNYQFQCDLDTIILHVDVENVTDLFAFSVTVKYDNSVLKLTQQLNGTFLESNPNSSSVHYESFPAIVSAYDSIIVDAAVLGIAGATGSGRLFSLKFVPLIRSSTVVKITSLSLRNSQNQEIFATKDSAIIKIAPSVSVDLTIENQSVVGSDFFFDVYLTRTGTNDLYLANADFVLFFNDFAFTSPTLSKVGSIPGFCTFLPTDATVPNIAATRDLYFTNTTASIVNTGVPYFTNLLKISVNVPTPVDQTAFDATIAKIDNSSVTHRLGRFKISGLWLTWDYSNLSWRTTTPYSTYVNTFGNEYPWCDYLANINPIDPPSIPLPVELTSFEAKSSGNKIILSWSTITETDNTGFDIERRLSTEDNWNKLGFIPGAGNSNSIKNYSFIDKTLTSSGKYFYRLKQINSDGTFSYSEQLDIDVLLTLEYSLEQNFPNPFNPSTTISYSIPQDGFVKMILFNALGEQVEILVSEYQSTGIYNLNFNASKLNSGIYFYKIEVNNFSAVKKMMVLK